MNSEQQKALEQINNYNKALTHEKATHLSLTEEQFFDIYLLGYSTALNDTQQAIKSLHDKQPS